ncbi:MAG: Pr6Pr family membrane protein [Oscillospiraceae bacterium]|nr:Pr6Pr family membrane protein [Oscillospiraceae bacterium]
MKTKKEKFLLSRRFAAIALAMGLVGFAAKLAVIFTYDGRLAVEYPDLISKWNFFGFYTYTTNILVDFWLVLIALAIFLKREKMAALLAKATVQAFLTVMIFSVGAMYCGVLVWYDKLYSWGLWWGNFATLWHHAVTPVFMACLFFRPADRAKLGQKDLWAWLMYPLAYLVVTLLRGGMVNWYPYPFFDQAWEMFAQMNIDPRLGVSLASAFVAAFITTLGLLAIALHNRMIEKRP